MKPTFKKAYYSDQNKRLTLGTRRVNAAARSDGHLSPEQMYSPEKLKRIHNAIWHTKMMQSTSDTRRSFEE